MRVRRDACIDESIISWDIYLLDYSENKMAGYPFPSHKIIRKTSNSKGFFLDVFMCNKKNTIVEVEMKFADFFKRSYLTSTLRRWTNKEFEKIAPKTYAEIEQEINDHFRIREKDLYQLV